MANFLNLHYLHGRQRDTASSALFECSLVLYVCALVAAFVLPSFVTKGVYLDENAMLPGAYLPCTHTDSAVSFAGGRPFIYASCPSLLFARER